LSSTIGNTRQSKTQCTNLHFTVEIRYRATKSEENMVHVKNR